MYFIKNQLEFRVVQNLKPEFRFFEKNYRKHKNQNSFLTFFENVLFAFKKIIKEFRVVQNLEPELRISEKEKLFENYRIAKISILIFKV